MIFNCRFCSICLVTLLCCLTIKRVDCAKKAAAAGKKGRKAGKVTAVPTVRYETVILTSEEREKLLRGEIFDLDFDNQTTVDWKLRKQLKLRPKKQLRGIIYARHLSTRNETPKWMITPRQRKIVIADNKFTSTTKESKRAIKRRMVKNYSWIDYSLSTFMQTYSTLPPELFTHSNVLVNKKNIVRPELNVTGTVIFLHGEGIKAGSMKVWVKTIEPPKHRGWKHIRLVYPTSPFQPYTIAEREVMYIWFDRESLLINSTENTACIDRTARELRKVILHEVHSGIPINRIVIGGYGMGGAMALHMAYRYMPEVAGVFAVGSYLNEDSAVYKHLESHKNSRLPEMRFVHGALDTFVPMRWSRITFKKLKELGVPGEYRKVPDEGHTLDYLQIALVYKWIKQILPDE